MLKEAKAKIEEAKIIAQGVIDLAGNDISFWAVVLIHIYYHMVWIGSILIRAQRMRNI